MRLCIVLILAATTFLSPVSAADWGNLQMRLVYDGQPPAPKRFNAGSAGEMADESLLVNENDRGIQNVFVYLYAPNESVAVHPEYSQAAASKLTMKIMGGKLVPRAAIARTTQTLVFQDSDSVSYNLKYELFQNKPFSALLPAGGSASATFTAEENMPSQISCVIHPWLVGQLLVRDNPYFALSDDHGRISISKLPTGKRTFVVWHERTGFVQRVVRDGQPAGWSRGRLTLDIQPGDNDLGEIKLPPEIFK